MAEKPTSSEYTVGQLATALGLRTKTVRYYDDIGLLTAARRTAAGYRVYGARERAILGFILKAKAVGLSLGEIREILRLKRQGSEPCRHVAGLLDSKIAEVERQLEALEAYRQELRVMRDQPAASSRTACVCSIIEDHPVIHVDHLRGAPRLRAPGVRGDSRTSGAVHFRPINFR